ncbi:MAG: toll/interleukin-1 receptor domain-containing protein [Crocinitomicaceae bacterium]|nr:toll/interleukin-1 receptor domain-containing protein [Crocinitomicaceae bacterium]
MRTTTNKSPLNIYVAWHPKFAEGKSYANEIYSTFCRDSKKPLSRGIGIPVFFRSKHNPTTNLPIAIDFKEADRSAIVLLIDDEMFNDANWSTYVDSLIKNLSPNLRIFPVELSKYARYQNEGTALSKCQFIKLNLEQEFEDKAKVIRNALLHDFCRLMMNIDATPHANIPPPIKLFLSHAKLDGEIIAKEFRSHIENNLKLNTFFDANDIADGYDFETQIKANLKKSAVIVFHSDEYSNREWCRIEVIVAKRNKSPLVVVHNIEKGENRSFPYIGNVPTIRWNNNFNDVIDLALIQVLNNRYSVEKIEKEIVLYGVDKKYNYELISSPPELFNFIDLGKNRPKNKKENIVVYPDPPLGIEELNVLSELDSKTKFITPIMFSEII